MPGSPVDWALVPKHEALPRLALSLLQERHLHSKDRALTLLLLLST